ncbi:hypothetical protein [Capnocytophaga sp. G2]|jgi:putative membrane protein|uniref:hypothetical protein n=1 Tax=Capnocytophaga sp. G2 TaxID=3110695 RepID=UPI002B4A826F|nr:hypothetical protein [Capnocytophaga sp. G2]MEB3004593.1 hypothetical protein [Capnocytophaga sp. G2]
MLVSLLLIFILLNSIIKLSFWKLWQVTLFGLIVGGFLWRVYDFASEQSQVTLDQMLSNIKILSDMAVLVTIESAIGILFCFVALRDYYQNRESRWTRVLRWFPGVLIFPCLFYGLAQAFFYFSGVDFQTITFIIIGMTLFFIIAGAKAIAWALPERDLRLEVHFLMSIFVTLLGLALTASGQIIYVPKSEPLNILLLSQIFLFFIALFSLGFFLNKFYWIWKSKRNKSSK